MRTCYMVKGSDISRVEMINNEMITEVIMKKVGSRTKAFQIANHLNMAIALGMQLSLGDRNIKKAIKDEVKAAIKATIKENIE